MKILLLNQTFYPDVAATAQYLKDLALGLAAEGHQVSVISSRRAYDDPEKRFARFEMWEGIEIHRVPSTGFGKAAKWRRAVDFASFIVTCTLKLLTTPRYDAVVALTSPPLISFLGAMVSKIRGARFYYWVMDLNPDEAIAAGWLQKDSVPAKLLERMSRFSLSRSDKVIALDRFMSELIKEKEIEEASIEVISPWSHDDDVSFDLEGRERFRREHGIGDKFVVMYSGNHSPCHPLDSVFEAAARLADDPRYLFCFVGGGSEHRKISKLVEEKGMTNVLCLPYQPIDELAGSLSAADLHVVVMGSPFVGMIHPCKIYNILSIASPFLYIGPKASHIGDIMEEFPDSPVCKWAKPDDVDEVMKHIADVANFGSRGEEAKFKEVAQRTSKNRLLPQFIEAMSAAKPDSSA